MAHDTREQQDHPDLLDDPDRLDDPDQLDHPDRLEDSADSPGAEDYQDSGQPAPSADTDYAEDPEYAEHPDRLSEYPEPGPAEPTPETPGDQPAPEPVAAGYPEPVPGEEAGREPQPVGAASPEPSPAGAVPAEAGSGGSPAAVGTAAVAGSQVAGPTGPAIALWPEETVQDLRERWRDVLLRFVDDPPAAADEAETLVKEALDAFSAAVASHKSELDSWRGGGGTDTEQMRTAVRRYQTLFDRLLDV